MRSLTDGVNACGTAGIAANRAARGGRGLCGGIVDEVTGADAAPLEGMVQTDPVTNQVREQLMSRTDVRESGGRREKNQLKTHGGSSAEEG